LCSFLKRSRNGNNQRCFASLNSPQDESAVSDMTPPPMRWALATRPPRQLYGCFPASLEQDALDEFWNDRSDLDLHVPLLPVNPGMHRYVLHREGKFDGQTPEFHHLAQAESNGDCPDVRGRRVPIRQDIT